MKPKTNQTHTRIPNEATKCDPWMKVIIRAIHYGIRCKLADEFAALEAGQADDPIDRGLRISYLTFLDISCAAWPEPRAEAADRIAKAAESLIKQRRIDKAERSVRSANTTRQNKATGGAQAAQSDPATRPPWLNPIDPATGKPKHWTELTEEEGKRKAQAILDKTLAADGIEERPLPPNFGAIVKQIWGVQWPPKFEDPNRARLAGTQRRQEPETP